MQFCGRVIIAILIMSLVFISGAYGIAIGGGVLAEGTSSGILNADANGATAIGSGMGDFSGNWWVENTAGMYAKVGVDIRNSDSYSYDYTLNPGECGGWPASSYPEVSARENLDVNNAKYIKAYAIARSATKFDAITSIEMIDSGKSASLVGYANEAVANANGVFVTQSTDASYPDSGSIDAFKCDASAIRWTPGAPKASATLAGSHTEALEFAQTAHADITTTKATNDLKHLLGVGKASVSATGNGKEAKSIENKFIGVFSVEQSASVDPSTAQALQSMKGVGYITGGMTSAKDGWKGKEAVATQTGAHSGNIITNKQNAQTDATGSIAGQDVELEYMPVTYGATGKTYDQLTDISYITSTKNGNKQATAQFDVRFGEHVQHAQDAKTFDSIDGASNNLNLIGVGKASVSATGNGKEAKSKENKFEGVFSVEQSAFVDPSTVQALQSMKGVGYITGEMTSAKDGWKEAVVTQTGAHSGNIITNNQNAMIDATDSIAGQEVELEYMPVSYQTRTNDQLTDISYTTSTKNHDKQAIAKFDVSYGEHVQHTQNAKTDASTAKASNNINLIGVGKASVSAIGNGKEAKSNENKFIGVFSVEQSASIDPSTADALQSMKGVGYITGGMTFAKDSWRCKEAVVTQTGAFSGNTITDNRNAQIDQTDSIAGQEVKLEHMPVSYNTGTYDTHWMIFSSLAKANRVVNCITKYINEEYIQRTWGVSAP